METTCSRCHQAVPAESCYCPACGLPQLFYSSEGGGGTYVPESTAAALRDPSSVEWRSALRTAAMLAVPAGLLSCGFSPVGLFGLFWIAAAAAWAVSLYVRRQRPVGITTGAGARIGLVTGLMAGWMAFGATGVAFFGMRFWFHQGQAFDQMWQAMVNQSLQQQVQAVSADVQALNGFRNLLLSPQGRAGLMLAGMLILELALLGFAAAGGALGARLTARSRSQQT
ncbi:MAG: zinc ribbon domain-containing protein [Terracidiphilus sp.]